MKHFIYFILFITFFQSNAQSIYLSTDSDAESISLATRINAEGLVINELMPSNSETVQDQDGGYDDWVELYNNSDVAISLVGYRLSDKPAEPDKWVFPNATISPKSYIIIWADEEQEQAGLHCNFKLSAAGESVILSDPSGVIIDQVTFPIVGDEKTYGRYPNGTGDFIELNPTYNVQNTIISSTSKTDHGQILVYPNPFSDYIKIDQNNPIHLVRIIDINGKEVYRATTSSKLLDLSHLNPGVYILEINHKKAIKIIK